MKKVFLITLVGLTMLLNVAAVAQSFNNNAKISYINHDLPKSPESASFQKYGDIPVGEYTGTMSVGVPLYSLKLKDLSLPISLDYHASGIKVNQEATWVGLGWDLIPGGRITLEIKGGYDQYTDQFLDAETKNVITYLKSVGVTNNSAINAYGKLYSDTTLSLPTNQGFDVHNFDNIVRRIIETGMAEPDIFHVNFSGRSFSFYQDLFTKQVKIIAEHNLYKVEQVNSYTSANAWKVTDDNGISYYFEQEEKTYFTTPLAGIFPEATTAWLLTRVVDTNGDMIKFTYANYGTEFPAPNISESYTTDLYQLNEYSTNIDNVNELVYQKPYYLTKAESKNTQIDFSLGTRKDMGGVGPRKLERIIIKNKQTQEIIRQIKFNYNYFEGTEWDGYYFDLALLNVTSNEGTTVQQRMKYRLKLNSVDVFGADTLAAKETSKFIYDNTTLPNKISLAQDHWGYYNGANNVYAVGSLYPPFVPVVDSLVSEGIMSSPYINNVLIGVTIPTLYNIDISSSLAGHANRSANESYARAGMLKTIVYPTGGWSNFEFELHKSYYSPTASNLNGGGFRIKRITNFTSSAAIAGSISYDYKDLQGNNSGVYLGYINYIKATNNFSHYETINDGMHDDFNEFRPTFTLFSNGNLSNDGPNIGYQYVIKKSIDYTNNANNGYVVKAFKVREGADVTTSGDWPFIPGFFYLPKTAERYLDGQLLREDTYSSTNTLVKAVQNFYTQKGILDTMFSMKAVDRKIIKIRPDALFPFDLFNAGYFFEPVRSYYTQLDSSKVTIYEPTGSVTTRSAFIYNNFNQPEYTAQSRSDGGTDIQYTTTPLSYTTLPDLPGDGSLVGNAYGVQHLRMKNMLNVPVESVAIVKDKNATEKVVAADYAVYNGDANLAALYKLETDAPIPINLFQKSVYNGSGSGYDFLKDSRYSLKQSVSYYLPGNYIKQVTDLGKPTAFVVDTLNEQNIAIINNAEHNNVAYTSFENDFNGNWVVTGGSVNILTAHTGKQSYNLTSGNTIAKSNLAAGDYLVSYWLHSGSVNVNSTTAVTGQALNGWTYKEHKITVAANGSITVSGTANIDELRLTPVGALLTSYTFTPFTDPTSVTDPKSMTTYYDYDHLQRLKNIKDSERNIIKSVDYHMIDVNAVTPSYAYFSPERDVTLIKNNCPAGQTGSSVNYHVPAGKYVSFISQADADLQAQTEINSNAQNYANANGTCATQNMVTFNYNLTTSASFEIYLYNNNTNEMFDYYGVSGTASLSLPEGSYSVIINEINYAGSYIMTLAGNAQTGNYCTWSGITLSGTVSLTIF